MDGIFGIALVFALIRALFGRRHHMHHGHHRDGWMWRGGHHGHHHGRHWW